MIAGRDEKTCLQCGQPTKVVERINTAKARGWKRSTSRTVGGSSKPRTGKRTKKKYSRRKYTRK
jgi:hypothetical protein